MTAPEFYAKHRRWLATVTFAADGGPLEVEHHFEELAELHDIVENGPDWNAIESIVVRLNPLRRQPVTIEEAREL